MKYVSRKIIIGVLVALSIVLSGCSAEKVMYEEKNYVVPAAKIDTMKINVKDRKVEFLPSEDKKVHVSYYESEKEFYAIELSDKKELSFELLNHKKWNDYIGSKASQDKRTIQVWLPAETIENLNVKTSNETIDLSSISVSGAVNIETTNGNIEFDKLNVGSTLKLETKNGDINGTVVGSYDDFAISSAAKKGKDNLPETKSEGDKTLAVQTNNGDIALEFVKR